VSLPDWVWPVALSPFIGSFLGVVVTRALAPRTIVVGRSLCPACGLALGARDLVPLLSFVWLKGRCRVCAAHIDRFHPAIELAALIVAIWAAFSANGAILWMTCLLGWTLLALAAIDFRHYLLPDFLTLPLIPLGLLAAWLTDPSTVTDSLIGAVAGLIFVIALRYVYGLIRHREGIGLGDAKLLAAAGAWVGWIALPSVVFIAALSGLVFAIGLRLSGRDVSATDRVPFGIFLSLGVWIVWLYGPLTS
jgi:leader peptidase (prepilin peptidase) / N-methyltransferase